MLTEDDRARVALGNAMDRLTATPEWKQLLEWVEAKIGASTFARLKAPSKSMDDCLSMEYNKGTLNGIELTLTAPYTIIREKESILADEAARTTDDDLEYRNRSVGYDDEQ